MQGKLLHSFWEAAPDLIVAAFALLFTLLIGHHLTETWNLRQKRKEMNLESVRLLHELYGELKEVVKIWRLAKRNMPPRVQTAERWTLMGLESKAEALVLRLATERSLDDAQCVTIGLFRQAIQTVRESIRNHREPPLGSRSSEEYGLFNQLAPRVTAIVSANLPGRPPRAMTAQHQLARIAGVDEHTWQTFIVWMRYRSGTPSERAWRALTTALPMAPPP